MPGVNVLREIEILIRSQYELIIIDTNEPERAEKYFKEKAPENQELPNSTI